MKQFEYVINDPLGIHARPAGQLSKLAKSFTDSVISIQKADRTVAASQTMKLMGMGIKQGDTVTISVEGGDEDAVLKAMEDFFKANF